ncbi:hypothetical protein NECAME_12987, partial [Necator americanus]
AYAVFCKEDGRRYAVKRALDAFRSSADRTLKLREVQKHELLPYHINLVQFCKAWEENGRLYILTELCERSLLDYCTEIHTVPEKEIWNIFIDILRDTSYTPEEGDAKYLAPEVLNASPTKAADVFSIGITILEVTTDLDLPSRGVSKDLTRLIKWLMSPDPAARPTTSQALSDSAIASRATMRSFYLAYHQAMGMVADHTNTVLMWLVALVHLLAIPFLMFFDALRKKKNHVCTTPYKGSTLFATHTPEVNGSIRHKRISRWDDDDSDTEGRYSRQNFTTLSKRFLEMEDQHNSGDPFPRYRLNFDDDTPSSSSEKNEVIAGSTTTTPISSTPLSKSRRSGSRAFTSEVTKWHPTSDDWSSSSRRPLDESDDDMLEKSPMSRGTMSCPPYRQPLRSRFRNRPIPRLDFSRVNESPESFSSPATNTDSTASSLSSATKNVKQRFQNKHSRMTAVDFTLLQMSGMTSSAEESS